ncbi:hypothetical protein EC973_006408 [Apophysomyces ossiformis]|uniref:Uncharacterized protein n=1 Tax=Apophysomyces ossiformis TaxID=679940 RepID=A0A8H7EU48_9FUNG|nr:hypothetical protein EC973_006408 [Apophysomyces ossiformis]
MMFPARYEPDLALNLEICEMINKKQGNTPREAATTLVRLVNSKNLNQAMMALTLLDNCVKNCGYPFHLQIATKEFLNELVRKFPERPAEWKVALADMSRHKDDLVHIKDMYRLLRFKGYRFPELRESSIAALAPSQTLKSVHELEEEDRVAQSAKLQELIRRGRPQDLVEANQLMKVMSGYDQRQKPDYKQKFEEELHKIQEKTILLYEMLESVKTGERIDTNETIVELRQACSSAQPKIQQMITNEEDTEKIENLLTLNDMINNAMAKFADIQKGLYGTHYEISGKPPTKTSSEEEPRQAISLIDLDDQGLASTATSSPPNSQPPRQNVMDELSDLFGQSSVSSPPSYSAATTAVDPFSFLPSQTPASPPQPAVSPALSAASLSTPTAAILSSPVTSIPANGNQQTVEHEPVNLVNKNGLQITLEISQVDIIYKIKAYFSNQSTAPMEDLTLLLASPKSMQLKMEPQSSQLLPPKSDRAVTQNITLANPNKEPLRLRYKVTYKQFGVDMELSGTYSA